MSIALPGNMRRNPHVSHLIAKTILLILHILFNWIEISKNLVCSTKTKKKDNQRLSNQYITNFWGELIVIHSRWTVKIKMQTNFENEIYILVYFILLLGLNCETPWRQEPEYQQNHHHFWLPDKRTDAVYGGRRSPSWFIWWSCKGRDCRRLCGRSTSQNHHLENTVHDPVA